MVKNKLDEDLTGNLPPVYEPFNALEDLVENTNDLESISEEQSNDIQSEFSFKPVKNPGYFDMREISIAEM